MRTGLEALTTLGSQEEGIHPMHGSLLRPFRSQTHRLSHPQKINFCSNQAQLISIWAFTIAFVPEGYPVVPFQPAVTISLMASGPSPNSIAGQTRPVPPETPPTSLAFSLLSGSRGSYDCKMHLGKDHQGTSKETQGLLAWATQGGGGVHRPGVLPLLGLRLGAWCFAGSLFTGRFKTEERELKRGKGEARPLKRSVI